MNCGFCHQEILETDTKATLLCDHIVHTRCLILRVMIHIPHDIECGDCNSSVVPPDMLHEINAHQNTNECDNLFETSEEFRNDVEKVIRKTKEFKKKRKLLDVKTKNVYQEFKLFLTPQKSIIKNYINDKVKIIKEFQEYKDAQKENMALKRLHRRFCDTHNVGEHRFSKFLSRKYPTVVPRFYFRFTYMMPNFQRKFRVCIH